MNNQNKRTIYIKNIGLIIIPLRNKIQDIIDIVDYLKDEKDILLEILEPLIIKDPKYLKTYDLNN